MWQRCSCPTNDRYADYGGRGIRVCERWRDFFLFVEDMGRRPEGLSLDRIDVNGGYCPENCRWADIQTQLYNRRGTVYATIGKKRKPLRQWCREHGVAIETVRRRYEDYGDWEEAIKAAKVNLNIKSMLKITINGKTKTLNSWAEEYDISSRVAWQRVKRDGWTWKKAITTPPMNYSERNFKRKLVKIDGVKKGFNEWCRHFGIPNSTIWKRMKKGITLEEALKT